MRANDRDLIRGGHYGQRSCEPHLKAEHMAAPTNTAYVKKVLANSEPSTHGTKQTARDVRSDVCFSNRPVWVNTFRLSTRQCRCRSRARASLRNRHQGPSIMGSEDKVEQSYG